MPTGYAPYVPPKNAPLSLWMANFNSVASANPSAYGFTPSNVATINAAAATFATAYAPLTSPDTKTKAAVSAFNAARAASLAQILPLAQMVSQSESIAPDDKTALGVTVRKTTRTPVPPPSTVPILHIVSMVPGTIQFQYRDTTTPTSKGKPFGVRNLQVFSNIGTVPATDPAQCTFNVAPTKSPFQLTYPGGNSGKVMTLFARWAGGGTLTSNGMPQYGPWGAALSFNLP
jgi:hypothetical protein